MSELTNTHRIPDAEAIASGAGVLEKYEVIQLLGSIGDADKTALVRISKAYARKTHYDYEDLLQEATRRVLDTREWPRGMDALPFLAGVIRSVAWDWRKRAISDELNENSGGGQEGGAEAKIEAMKIVALFDDDPIAQRLVIGMMEGVRGEELRNGSGLSNTEYESKRKKIRRRLEKLEL